MTRGNQRDLARQKAQKKQQKPGNKNANGEALVKRKENDAETMRIKQMEANKKKEEGEAAKRKAALESKNK